MKETSRTPVPLPGSKARTKAPPASSKAQLSQELIGSDDDSQVENAPPAKVAKKPKTAIAVHRPNGVDRPKAKSEPKPKPQPSTIDSRSAKTAPQVKATHSKPASTRTTTKAPAAVSSSSSQQSSDSDAPASKSQADRHNQGAADESDSDSSSDSSSDDADGAVMPTPSRTSAHERARPSQSQSHTVEFQPARPYEPPKGFAPVRVDDQNIQRAVGIFQNLQGKQIWHITAPAGVSLKDLKQMAMHELLEGEAVLNYRGTDYGFSQTHVSEECQREVLVPHKTGYKTVPARISQTLHLQAVVRLPALSSKQADPNTGSEAAASITRSTIRAPRAQVTGLKMRFLPTGFGGDDAGVLGDSDSEMVVPTETAGLGMPNELNLPSRKEKRKHADVNGGETAELPSKKSKKHRNPEDLKRKEDRRAKKEKRRAQDAAVAKS